MNSMHTVMGRVGVFVRIVMTMMSMMVNRVVLTCF